MVGPFSSVFGVSLQVLIYRVQWVMGGQQFLHVMHDGASVCIRGWGPDLIPEVAILERIYHLAVKVRTKIFELVNGMLLCSPVPRFFEGP